MEQQVISMSFYIVPAGFDYSRPFFFIWKRGLGWSDLVQNGCYIVSLNEFSFTLLPFFFRGFGGEKYPVSSEDAKARFSQVTVISHSKLMSPSSVGNSDSGTTIF